MVLIKPFDLNDLIMRQITSFLRETLSWNKRLLRTSILQWKWDFKTPEHTVPLIKIVYYIYVNRVVGVLVIIW